MTSHLRPSSFDHVALWVAERDRLAAFLCDHLGMHVIDRTDRFTLVGVDAKLGKLTLFAADGPRERGALARVALRVGDVERAAEGLPDYLDVSGNGESARFEAPAGLPLALVAGDATVDYDLDHVVLRVPDPETAADRLTQLGFERRDGRLAVANRHLVLEPGDGHVDNPLLNHLALLVESAEGVRAEAEGRGVEVEDFVDAPNTLAVFLRGPDGIRLEYVEHKPGFSLV